MKLVVRPVTLREANAFVGVEHRHNKEVRGHRFSLGAYLGDRLVGVVVVGRTVAAGLHAPLRCEVTRCCTDGTKDACSFLYSKAVRVAQAMGYVSCKTYTRTDESGASLRALGLKPEATIPARSWAKSNRRRTRVDQTEPHDRHRWELLP